MERKKETEIEREKNTWVDLKTAMSGRASVWSRCRVCASLFYSFTLWCESTESHILVLAWQNGQCSIGIGHNVNEPDTQSCLIISDPISRIHCHRSWHVIRLQTLLQGIAYAFVWIMRERHTQKNHHEINTIFNDENKNECMCNCEFVNAKR